MIDVVIIVREGRVGQVFADNEDIFVTVHDLDTQDPEEQDNLDKAVNEVKSDARYHEVY